MHCSWWYGIVPRSMTQVLLVLGLWSVAVGCGEGQDDLDTGKEVTGSNDAGADTRRSEDAGPGEDATDAAAPDAGPPLCDGAEDLGVLTLADPTVVSRSLRASSGAPMSCTPSGGEASEYTFAFQVDQLAILETTVSSPAGTPPAFGLHQGSCEADAEQYCSLQSPWRAIVEPGQTYHLKVQAGADATDAAFTTSFDLQEAACVPGEQLCRDGTSERCVRGTSVDTYECAGDCTSEASCSGDACPTALTVEPAVGGGAVRLEGDRWAYTHQWNAADLSDCEASEAIGTGDTTAMELFVRVPNLQAGQTLEVSDAVASGSYLYFVLDDCTATSCRAAAFIDAAGDNRLVWEVPENGDYIVVIEATSNNSRPFQFDFLLR